MKYKFNKAVSLIEVLVTVMILSTAIIFVFRSFAASLASSRLVSHITQACFVAENQLTEIEERQKLTDSPLSATQGREQLEGKAFNWNYETNKLGNSNLLELKLVISWQEKTKEKPYSIPLVTYLRAKAK